MQANNCRRLTTTPSKNADLVDIFRCFFDEANDASFILDTEGKVVAINRKSEQLLEQKQENLARRSYSNIVPANILRQARESFQRVIKGNPIRFEVTLKTAKKNVLIEVTLNPCVARKKVIAALGIVRDITGTRQAHEELANSEERFRSVADCAADAIITIDSRGLVVFWNKAAETIFGYSAVEMIEKPVSMVIPKDSRKNHQNGMYRLISTGIGKSPSRTYEFIGRRKNGEEFPLEFSFSNLKTRDGAFFTGIFRDVTERKKAEEALRQSEAKFRTLFENVPDGVYQSTPKGKIITANPALVQMLGYSSLNELCSLNVACDIYSCRNDRKTWIRKIQKNGHIRNAELVLKRKDGQKLIVLENASAVRNEQGETVHYEGTLTDITERKMLEERLSTLNFYSGKLNAAQNLQQVYKLTLDALEHTLGRENASVLMVARNNLQVVCRRGSNQFVSKLPLEGKRGITVKAANSRVPVLVPDVNKEKDYIEGTPGVRSELAAPVMTENRVLGVLDVESEKLGAFSERDVTLLQVLASHAATAISNLEKREEIEKRSVQTALLMKNSAEIIHSMDLSQQLQKIATAIREFGWRRVVIRAVRSEDLEIENREDLVTAGLTNEEIEFLWKNRTSGHVWRERLGPEFERFKIGEFYHLPWSDPWVRQKFSQGTVPSKLSQEEMVDWDPEDLLYAPLKSAGGHIVGILSIDDPLDGRRPTIESLAPLELFLYQAAIAMEKAQLFKQLTDAKNQIREHADKLEVKVEERTKDLRESEEKLRSIFISSPDAITVTDLNGKVTQCNQATLTQHGFSSFSEVIGKKALEFIAEKDHKRALENMRKTLHDGSIRNVEYTFLAKNGREFPAELSASVIQNSSGNPIAFVAMTKDITARKQAEEALRVSQQRLVKSERLATVGEVAAMVGHDLRNPLTGIVGATYYLRMKLGSKLGKKEKEMLGLIEKNIEYSDKIVNDLLDYSREMNLELAETNPKVIVKEALSLVKIPAKIKISNCVQSKPKIHVDSEKMKRVFANIIKNAIDAMPTGGELTVRSKRVSDNVEIVFADTGIGMTKDVLQKIWSPLFTTKAKGMGFGLAICKRIIESHGGKITVKSAAGRGTTFTMTIPIEPKLEGGENVWVNVPGSLLSMTMKA
jgi:PAS domain S-box-containing protein